MTRAPLTRITLNTQGRITHQARFKLWQPQKEIHQTFPLSFRRVASCLLMAHRRPNNQLSRLSEDEILYILNFCSWDWFQGAKEELKALGRGTYDARTLHP